MSRNKIAAGARAVLLYERLAEIAHVHRGTPGYLERMGEAVEQSEQADLEQLRLPPTLSLREHFAGQALAGLLANDRWFMNVVNDPEAQRVAGLAEKRAAEAAWMAADAMLESPKR